MMSTDMKGPIRIPGLKGQRFYQGCQDGCTKYLTHKCFIRKSEAPDNLKFALNEPIFKDHLEIYHSDGALELLSKHIVELLAPRGIKMTLRRRINSAITA